MAKWSGRVCVCALLVWCVLFLVAASENQDVEKDTQKNGEDGNDVEGNEEGETRKGDSIDKTLQVSINAASDGSQNVEVASLGFIHAFIAAFSVIIVSEIGDKTFFIAAILAMKHSRWLVFGGAISALAFMTFLSVCLGYATVIIPRWLTFYICTFLLAIFGIKMLYDGWKMSPDEGQEEFEEVSAELKKREEQNSAGDIEMGRSVITTPPLRRRLWCLACFAPILLQSFTLTFLAEWGDRSQLTTIILSAREDPLGVILGGTIGHALCTALAVLGGKMIAQRISVRTVTFIGGVVFIVFALTAIFHDPTLNESTAEP